MGRPINKKSFGAPTAGELSIVFSSCWIPGEGAAAANCYVVKQVATSSYLAMNPATGNTGVVTLVQTISAAGQAVLSVAPSGAGVGAQLQAVMKANAGTLGVGGTGYAVNDTVTLVGGTGTKAVFTVDTVNGSGAILTMHLSTPGAYTVLPASGAIATTTSGAGTGATITVTNYGIASVTVANGGEDFPASGVTATVSGSGGGAVALTVSAGAIASASVTTPGTYSAIPAISAVSPVATETAEKITSVRVKTFEGNTYSWHNDGTVPGAGYAALPLFS